ncbi:MAG TPA: LacI family DNA-binding transcriptional regulator [Baekduia sp.]|jgi:DNA-binding LacI/PurR family transcriptional regulator|nr:LacI family DNA-binding transcriptional regulator [Baekduia sp.]
MATCRLVERPRITLKQVAEDVGVSPMTVSNAFNRPDQLSAALRERILERARKLGYPGPDPMARGLRRGHAGAIGVISDTKLSYAFDDPAASAVIAGVCAVTEEEGLGVLLVPPGGSAPLSGAVIDGIVVYSVAQGDPLLALAVARRLPAVVIDQPVGTGLPRVGIDDEAAARTAARHLTALGHRRVAVVAFGLSPDGRTGPADLMRRRNAGYAVSRARLAGYGAAADEAGIDWAGVPVHECAGSIRAAGRAAAERLLAAEHRPTAILATSDVLALGVLDAAAAAGLRVPHDVSVVGFDDVPAAAEARLTTIRQDHRAKGRLAGELLVAALRGERVAAPATLPHELVVRDSTAPPATA